MGHLIELPTHLLVDILQLIQIEDLAKFDTSICNHSLRNSVFEYLSHFPYPFKSRSTRLVEKSFIEWLSLRQFSIDKLTFTSSFCDLKIAQNVKFGVLNVLHVDCIKHNEVETLNQIARQCRHLKDLILSRSLFVSDDIVETFATCCPNISRLSLGGCISLTDKAIQTSVGSLSKLIALCICGCIGLSIDSYTYIATNCPNLTNLNCNDCKVSQSVLCEIVKGCSKIEEFGTAGNVCFTDAVLLTCANHWTGLRMLIIEGCVLVSDHGMAALLRSKCAPSLVELTLSSCFLITDNTLLSIAERASQLRKLHVSHCVEVSDIGISALAVKCTQLVELKMQSCLAVTDASLLSLSQHCASLEVLNIVDCYHHGDMDITLLCGCTLLKEVLFSSSDCVLDSHIVQLVESCHCLTSLDLSFCPCITDTAVHAVALHCPRLTSLDLYECRLVTIEGIRSLGLHSKELISLNIYRCNVQVTVLKVIELHFPALELFCSDLRQNTPAFRRLQAAKPKLLCTDK